MNGWILTKVGICIDIDEILVGIFMCKIVQIYNRVVALDSRQNFVWLNILRMNGWNSTKFCLILTKSRLEFTGIVLPQLMLIYNRVMALNCY